MSQDRITVGEIQRLIATAQSEGFPQEVFQRLRWFMLFAENHSISRVCNEFRISRSTFYRWANRFDRFDLHSLEDNSASFPKSLSDSVDTTQSAIRSHPKTHAIPNRFFHSWAMGLFIFAALSLVNAVLLAGVLAANFLQT